MQFVIIGRNGSDPEVPATRERVRPAHLDGLKKLCEGGHVISAGPILTEEGAPNGSFLIFDFPTRADLDAYLANEPYATAHVWKDIEIIPCKAGFIDNKMV